MLLKPLLQAKNSKDTQLPKRLQNQVPIHTKRPPLEEEKSMQGTTIGKM
jgi:hypothetical protein